MATKTQELLDLLNAQGEALLSKLDIQVQHLTESNFHSDSITGIKAYGHDGTDFVPIEAANPNLGPVAAKTFVDARFAALVDNAPSAYNTLGKIQDAFKGDPQYAKKLLNKLRGARLQIHQGDGSKTDFHVGTPFCSIQMCTDNYGSSNDHMETHQGSWENYHAPNGRAIPPKAYAGKVDVWLNGIKLKSQITDSTDINNERNTNLTNPSDVDYLLFGLGPESLYRDDPQRGYFGGWAWYGTHGRPATSYTWQWGGMWNRGYTEPRHYFLGSGRYDDHNMGDAYHVNPLGQRNVIGRDPVQDGDTVDRGLKFWEWWGSTTKNNHFFKSAQGHIHDSMLSIQHYIGWNGRTDSKNSKKFPNGTFAQYVMDWIDTVNVARSSTYGGHGGGAMLHLSNGLQTHMPSTRGGSLNRSWKLTPCNAGDIVYGIRLKTPPSTGDKLIIRTY